VRHRLRQRVRRTVKRALALFFDFSSV
jgi:hypothetical protein